MGPSLKGIFGSDRALTGDKTVRADREYLRSSILKPTAHVANGFQAAMPSYSGILDAGQIESLIVYSSQLR